MDKKDMAASMGDIANRPKTISRGAISGSKKEKKAKERKVISITGEDYRKLKLYAAEQGITITDAFTRIVESSTILQ